MNGDDERDAVDPARVIRAEAVTAAVFAPWGEVLEATGDPDRIINEGRCGRWNDRARLDVEGRAGISVFRSQAVALPYRFRLVERHPLGSQAFLPMTAAAFLVIVAPDEGGTPGRPRAFLTAPGQGVNLTRGAWHGVLTPLSEPGLFAVVDRCAEGPNLQEYRWDDDWQVVSG